MLPIALLAVGCNEPGTSAADERTAVAPPAVGGPRQSEAPGPSIAKATAEAVDAGPNDPRTIVESYFAALSAGDQARAGQFRRQSTSSSEEQSRDGLSGLSGIGTVEVGRPGRVDSGAGNRYVEVPVRFNALDAEARTTRMAGIVTLHRSVVDGGDPRWRIETLRARPLIAAEPNPANVVSPAPDDPAPPPDALPNSTHR